ncbi:MAG: type III pantothenate kinase [Lachnospiraceae bacterium]|nr:type III pantothenate kinase [Lachnospiraceae bacterium]
MLLVFDVGNTNIKCGLYDGDKLVHTFRFMTKTPRTSDEFGMTICDLAARQGADISRIDGVIIASVVPDVMHSLIASVKKYLNAEPVVVGPGIKTGINIDTPNPKEIGPDRIVDAVAAYELYGGPVLVLDFGTATTYDVVTADGRFTAGITAPGIGISAEALWNGTAKLPKIEIMMPKSILATDTVWSMQAGLMYGQVGQTEYIIKQVRKETGYDDLKVIATGGLGRIISNETDMIDEYNSDLALEGLRLIYAKNR